MNEGRKKQPRFEESAEKRTEETQTKKTPDKISFDSWMTLRLRKKTWLRDSIEAFFRGKGLSNKEEIKTYDNAFEKF